MTAQFAETLIHEGREASMCSEPLGIYFAFGGMKPEFQRTCSALWRGYIGTWEIVNDRLYLVGLAGALKGGMEATLETVFPGYPGRVFAHWYTGALRIPEGRRLEYVHIGYQSTYERDRLIRIRKGVVTDSLVWHNGKVEDESGPEGYGVGAWATFQKPVDEKGNN